MKQHQNVNAENVDSQLLVSCLMQQISSLSYEVATKDAKIIELNKENSKLKGEK